MSAMGGLCKASEHGRMVARSTGTGRLLFSLARAVLAMTGAAAMRKRTKSRSNGREKAVKLALKDSRDSGERH